MGPRIPARVRAHRLVANAAKVAATPTTSAPATGSRQFPGAFGVVAAASPGSIEVQNTTSGQTTVTYTSATTFTQVARVPESA